MKQAVILAAGEGQRLRPFTVNRPKAMLSIAGKPILQYVVESLAQNGIRKIVLVVGYRKEQVFDYMGSGERFGVEITYATQKEQLGTAPALAETRALTEDSFLVLPGDKLIEAETIANLMTAGPEAVLVKRVANPTRYGVVSVEDGKVKEIVEKPKETTSNIINLGVYAFTREIFDFIDSELNITDAMNRMVERGHSINALPTDGAWLDVVYPWDILALNSAVLRRIPPCLGGTIEKGVTVKGRVSVGQGTVIKPNCYIVGPVVIGEGCELGPDVCIMPATSIGDNVIISPFTEVKNSTIGSDVSIGAGSIVQDSVIDKGCIIKGHFNASSGHTEIRVGDEHHRVSVGAMMGEGCRLDTSVVAQPGVLVGNYCQVQALKMLGGRLPDKSLVF